MWAQPCSPADGSRSLMLQGLRLERYKSPTCWLTWTWHVLSRPDAHTQGGGNHSSLWSAVKGKSLRFYRTSKRATAGSRVVIFQFVSGWQSAAVCHTVDLEETFRDVMIGVHVPRQGRKTCSCGAKRFCGHTFLNSSSAAYSHDQNIRSSHANTAVTTSRFSFTHIDVYVHVPDSIAGDVVIAGDF